MYDCIIIGGGPGALSSAVNLKARNKDFILFAGIEKEMPIEKSHWINNYLGMLDVSGKDLMDSFRGHAIKEGTEIKNEKVYNILSMGDYYVVSNGNDFFETKTLIMAIGQSRGNYYEGELKYLGKGVGYCATCDGPLYKGKTVIIISENKEGEEEANFMSEICEKVYYLKGYKGDSHLVEKVEILKGKPLKIEGKDGKAEKLVTEAGETTADGIFIIRNVIPVDQLLEGLETKGGHIVVDRTGATSLPGVFACGDCTGKPYQVAKAVGEGNVAALSVATYLDKTKA